MIMIKVFTNLRRIASQFAVIASLTLISSIANAEMKSIEAGPQIGSKVADLNLLDQFSDKQDLSNILGPEGAIIVLFRSADWCPFCKRHLLELNAEAEAFKQAGYGVTAISYDSPEILRIFSQSNKLNYSLLSDQNVESFKALKVVNAEYSAGDRHYGIPYPGVIVVNKNAEVVHKYFFEGYKQRVKFKQLLQTLTTK